MKKLIYLICSTLVFIQLSISLAYAQSNQSTPDDLTIAVASNFSHTLDGILNDFHSESCKSISVSTGSTGKITTQIIQGAPFDIFLSADVERPKYLEQNNLTVKGSRFTYAVGQIVLWAPNHHSKQDIMDYLSSGKFKHLAIANPKLAPYGLSAYHYLKSTDLWDKNQSKIVLGENINQAFHFVTTGNAELGIISLAQALRLTNIENIKRGNEFVLLAQDLNYPIEQQAVLLNKAAQNQCALKFLEHLKQPRSEAIMALSGYTTNKATA